MTALDVTGALAAIQTYETDDGTSMYEQFVQIVTKILEEKPTQAVDLLETSLIVKKTAFNGREASPLVPIPVIPDTSKAEATASLYGNHELPINPRTGEPIDAEPPNDYESHNVVGDGDLFDALGVGIGKQETYGISLAIKKLGEDPKLGVKSVRFFGKFFGLYADYFIFEAQLKTAPEIPDAPEGQVPYEKNVGANKSVYFACNYLGGPLTQLPHVIPAQIKVSRLIKKLLTGRLSSHVSTYPVFPGNEANYLRAMIARIGSATVACPSGSYSMNDETNQLQKEEDFEPLPGQEMAQAASWVHMCPHLKQQGRCEVHKRELPEDADEEEFYNEDELEEEVEVLAALEADVPLLGEVPAWTPLLSSSSEAVKNQVGGLRSNLWPGAFCAAKGAAFANVYVGWGIKNAAFVPRPPPPVAKEFDQTQVESQELPPKPAPPPAEEEEEQ